MERTSLGPAGLSLAAALIVCVVAPPEVRGFGLAAAAFFVLLASIVTAATAASRPAACWVLATIPPALLAMRMAIAPGEAVEPVAVLFLAALAGLAAAVSSGREERFAQLLAVLVAWCGVRALYETFWGLPAWAARVRAEAPAGDALAILSRLEQGRPYGGFLTPAALGGFLILTVPAVVAWALDRRGRVRAAGLAASAAGAAGLMATRSMSAMGALLVALALAALKGRVAPAKLAAAAAIVGLAIVGAGLLRSDAVFSPGQEDSPWRLRAGNVRAAAEMAREHPLAGVGPGGYAEAFPQHRRAGDNESRHAHDLPAELVAEWGIPVGLALSGAFFVLFLGPILNGRVEGTAFATGLAIGLAGFAVQNLADFTAFLPGLLVLAAVGRGLLVRHVPERHAGVSARAAWIALALVVTLVTAGSGLAREALFDARNDGASGEHAQAVRLAQRAMMLAPWDADAPQIGASARLAQGTDPAAALADADRAVLRAPARAAARVVRARARLASGDAAGAFADLAEASRLYPLKGEYAAQRDAVAEAIAKAKESAPR